MTVMTELKMTELNTEVMEELRNELGEHYVDVIELEWDMEVSQFIEMFWNEQESCFDI